MGLNVKLDAQEATLALTRFIRDHVEDAGVNGVVLGLSGGLDSAVAAALAVRALGSERVHPVFMPAASTPPADREQVQRLCDQLGLRLRDHNVDPIIEAVTGVTGQSDRDTIANAAARARMSVLYAIARNQGLLVLGTSNKSELLVGYFTKYGDGGSDLLPMGDLYKTQVRILAGHLGLPQWIIDKAPTAGLWEGQTDEDELGINYTELDRILLGFELGMDDERTAQAVGTTEETVRRIAAMVRRSEHKRQTPRACKMGIRSITSDWRRSVTEGGPEE